MIYLDNNATTALLPEVSAEIAALLEADPSNPSSPHSGADSGRQILRSARERVADLIGASPEQVFFTSGGTEANAIVLLSGACRCGQSCRRVITSPVEHSSVLRTLEILEQQGLDTVELPVDADGIVCLDSLREALRSGPALVSIQWVSNETGVIQDIEAIRQVCHASGALLHTDAAQAVGKLRVDVSEVPVDYLTMTAHKWHGPAGVGAVYARTRNSTRHFAGGGDQESGRRPGTENLLGMAGMGAAAVLRRERLDLATASMQEARDAFEDAIRAKIPGLRVNGGGAQRVCNTSNLLFPDVDGQAMLARLDIAGLRCSQGSACDSMLPTPSHVLRALGLTDDEAYASLRFSFSELSTVEESRAAADMVCRTWQQMTEGVFSG